jgi:hypothetical protein
MRSWTCLRIIVNGSNCLEFWNEHGYPENSTLFLFQVYERKNSALKTACEFTSFLVSPLEFYEITFVVNEGEMRLEKSRFFIDLAECWFVCFDSYS